MNIKFLPMAIFLLLASGCSSTMVQPEQSDRYAKLEAAQRLNVKSLELPQVPHISVESVNGVDKATLDSAGMNQLNAYRQAAKQNTEALSLLTDAHNGLIDQRNLMLQNLRLEESRANFFALKYAESESLRREQYKDFQFELMIHKAALFLFGVLVVF